MARLQPWCRGRRRAASCEGRQIPEAEGEGKAKGRGKSKGKDRSAQEVAFRQALHKCSPAKSAKSIHASTDGRHPQKQAAPRQVRLRNDGRRGRRHGRGSCVLPDHPSLGKVTLRPSRWLTLMRTRSNHASRSERRDAPQLDGGAAGPTDPTPTKRDARPPSFEIVRLVWLGGGESQPSGIRVRDHAPRFCRTAHRGSSWRRWRRRDGCRRDAGHRLGPPTAGAHHPEEPQRCEVQTRTRERSISHNHLAATAVVARASTRYFSAIFPS
jgi:hypothetical protein